MEISVTRMYLNSIENFFKYLSYNRTSFFRSNLLDGRFKKESYRNKYIYRGLVLSEKEFLLFSSRGHINNRYNRELSAWTLDDLSKDSKKDLITAYTKLYKYCRPSLLKEKKFLIILKKKLDTKEIKLDVRELYNNIAKNFDIDPKVKRKIKKYVFMEREVITSSLTSKKDIVRVISIN